MRLELGPTDDVFVLTGAGISAESGVATFRDANGLWENHRVEEVATPEAFATQPVLVWRFYAQRRAQAKTVAPNAGHRALAALEARLGDRFFLCTQNVDNLHEAAGSTRLVHMHGELFKSRCSDPACDRAPFVDERSDFTASLPRCPCGELERPHIVWFGETPFEMHAIERQTSAPRCSCASAPPASCTRPPGWSARWRTASRWARRCGRSTSASSGRPTRRSSIRSCWARPARCCRRCWPPDPADRRRAA